MKIIRGIENAVHDPNSVVTVGSFDGVHLAHREIIREVVRRARVREGRSVVVTFDPHPSEVVVSRGKPTPLVTTLDERIELIGKLDIDLIVVIAFTREFSTLSPYAFYGDYVIKHIGLAEVVIGYDHMFGHNRGAGVHELIGMGQKNDFSVFAVHPYMVDGEVVGSTLIRKALLEGNIDKASSLLGYRYFLSGTVVRGDGIGQKLGYPTANVSPASRRKLVPAPGVYLVAVHLQENELFGMMNIGTRPTVSDRQEQTLEVHLFDVERDIYGKELTITFLKRLRDEKKFSTPQDLVRQLDDDRLVSMKLLSELKGKS